MTVPGQFPRRMSRAASVTVAESADVPGDPADGSPPHAAAPGSWPWRRAALLLCISAQLITISALESADPIPASWAALLLAIAPAPLAAVTAFAPARVARVAVLAAAAGIAAGIAGQVTHTGLFFVPALAALAVAAVRLWREEP
jgi:hypothetical protein